MGAFFEIFLELGGVVGWQRFPLDMVRARVILTVLMARLFQQSVYVLREICHLSQWSLKPQDKQGSFSRTILFFFKDF